MRCGNLSWKTLPDYRSRSISEENKAVLSSSSSSISHSIQARTQQPTKDGEPTQPNSLELGRRMKGGTFLSGEPHDQLTRTCARVPGGGLVSDLPEGMNSSVLG